MWPLFIVGIWLWTLIFIKLRQIYIYSRKEVPLMRQLSDLYLSNREINYEGLPQVWREFFEHVEHSRTCDKKFHKVISNMVMSKFKVLEHHITTILVLSSIAPLLGLLGTVTGMISTFDVIREFGTGNPRALASGISEALITTQTGLVIALPGLFMGSFIKRRIASSKMRLERFCLHISRLVSDSDNADGERLV